MISISDRRFIFQMNEKTFKEQINRHMIRKRIWLIF